MGANAVNRRQFLEDAALALGGLACLPGTLCAAEAADIASRKPKRVGLIGTGWYGKSDLMRLIQVAPVEVVSLCDPDKKLLAEAAEWVRQRQKSKKVPAPTATIARCSRRKTSKSCSSAARTTGTPCT